MWWVLGVAVAQDEPSAHDDGQVEEVVVVMSRIQGTYDDQPVSATVLDEPEIGGGRATLEFGEALAQVPGVFVSNRSNFAQDTRLSIRGFGSRAAFGIRGVRVVLDGIPLTLPDGQSQIDSLDLQNIGRIEVLRGPAGSLYGNAAGGVLLLETKRPGSEPEAEAVNTVGAFGLWKSAIGGRTRAGDTDVSLFASRTQMAGWRVQSAMEQVVAQTSITTALGPTVRWSTHVHYVNAPTADDPGGVTVEQLADDPREAAQTNLDFETGEALSQLQAGTRLVASPLPNHRVEVVGHVGARTFEGRIPFRIVTFSRDVYGVLGMYGWKASAGPLTSHLTAGLEVQAQQDRRRNEGNEGGRSSGETSLDQIERATGLGVFVQERLGLSERVTFLGSGRYDRVGFSLIDRLLSDGDVTGARVFDRATGQGGVLAHVTEGVTAFTNLSQSFETPTFSELVSASGDGGLDAALRPQEALSVEGGVRIRGPEVAVDVAAFWIGLRNELIRQEDEEGRAFFDNAGRSRRIGAEAVVRVEPVEGLEVRGSYTWLRSEFRDGARRGARVPGLPEHHGFVRVRGIVGGLRAAAEAELTSARWADDANTVRAPGSVQVGARVGYTLSLLEHLSIGLTLGVRNLLGVASVDNLRVNAFGDRYFEAGAPRHLYGQLTVARR